VSALAQGPSFNQTKTRSGMNNFQARDSLRCSLPRTRPCLGVRPSTCSGHAAKEHTSLRKTKSLPVLRSAYFQPSDTDPADFWESFNATLNVRHTPLEDPQERADQRISQSWSNQPRQHPAPPPRKDVQHRRRFFDAHNRVVFQQRLRQLKDTSLRQLEQQVASRGGQGAGSSISPGVSGPTRLSKLMLMAEEGGRIPDGEYGGMFATGDEEAEVGFAPVRVLWATKNERARWFRY